MWMQILLGVAAVAALVAGVLVWRAQRDWAAASNAMAQRLREANASATVARFTDVELERLPAPVARYFRTALREGQPIVRRARIGWRGEFNMGGPGQDAWKPFTATQEFVPGAPGFVWDARIRMAPGVAVLVRDGLVDGLGSMRAAVLGLVTVVDARGTPTLAAGALQRYLGEAAWFPTALLPSQGVTWSAIDDTRARASISAGATSVALEFRFGSDGLIAEAFAPDRFYDDGKGPAVPRPWRARNLRHEERGGMQVPADSVVEWELPDGRFPYWRGRPVEIELEYSLSAAEATRARPAAPAGSGRAARDRGGP